jgi:hypothetical protein
MSEKKKSSKEVQQTFLLSFIGEYVNVVTDIMITDFTSSEEGQLEQNAPMVSRGYMLDCDSDYLYLGEDPFEITQAVQRKRIVLIQREIKNSAYTEMLNGMPDPKKKEDIN